MEPHLFRVGQVVTIDRLADAAGSGAVRRYKILCLLPPINGAHAYRVKAIMETEPRVAMESQCTISHVPPPVFCLNEIETRRSAASGAGADTALVEEPMSRAFIRVTQQQGRRWRVLRGLDCESPLTFRLKAHAIAYGRALSCSGKLTLFIDDRRGIAVEQEASSLTYPRSLN